MALSITENPEAFFEELNKPQKEEAAVKVSPVAPVVAPVTTPLTGNNEPAKEEPKAKEVSVADDPEAFFAGLTKPVETKEETPQDLVLSQLAGKTGAEMDDFDMQSLDLLSPKELEEVTNTRKDIPLTENLLRTKFDYEMSLPWNEGVNTLEDWKEIGKEVFGGGVSFLKGAQKFAEQSLFAEADQDPSGWGHPSFKPIKDYASGITALPESAAYLFTKLKEGGIGLKDRLSESLGIQDREKSYENYKARNLVDRIQTQEMQENPSIYSRILKGDMANDALAYVVLNTLPDRQTLMERDGLTAEQADSKRMEIANSIARQTTAEIASRETPADEDIATFATFTAPAGTGLGEMGLVSLGLEAGMGLTPKLIQGAKYLGKTDQEIKAMNDAAQALQKETAMKGLEQAQKPSMLGRAAGALATGIEKAEAVSARIGEATPKILKELAPPAAGAVIAGGDHRGEGAIVGALLGKAGKPALAALKYAAKTPALVRDIEEARVLAAGGSKGTFETLASFPEVSENTAKILRFGGRRLDNTLNNVVEYAKAGINPTLIALATGALESASPEELNKLTSTGLLYGLGGRVVHHAWGKITGVDPIIDARNRRQQDIDDLKTYRDLDPETRKTLDSVTSWDNIVDLHTQRAANAEQAYNDAVALGKKDAENLGKVAQAEKNILSAVTRANVQTRDEFSRQFVTQLTKLNQLVNGTLRAGQNNVGINILTPEQIVAKFRQDPANATATDQELLDIASQRGFYSTPEGAVEYQAGMGMDAPKKKVVFDRTKPSIVINSEALKTRMMVEGSTPIDALNHEAGHHVRNIPEFREANKDAEELLFSQEVKDPAGNVVAVTAGQYSGKDLVDMYLNSYLKGKTPEQITQLSQLAGLWDYSRGALNENAVAEYMKDEIIAELNSETFSTHLGKGLDSGVLHMVDVARLKTKKNLLDRAVQKFFGLGGKGEATSDLTGARFSPEVLAANRQAMRALQSLQGEVSQAVTAVDSPKISRSEMLKNKAIRERYGKYAGLFKTKMQGQVFDGNGNPIGSPIDITNPSASEGAWESRNGVTTQLNGYGARPDEVAETSGVVIPDGGRLVVQKQIVTQPDGVTPVMMEASDAKKLQKARADVIRQSLNTPDEGAPNRFEAVADGSDTWRGTFTPLQIQAIKDMPEGIIPKSIKEHMLKINDMIVKGDGSRMLVDYAAVMNDAGKYTAYSPKIYDVVPIGMHLSSKGNFLVTTLSVGRMFDKLNAWSERMPARLAPWGGSKDAFFKEFTEKYLQNWQNGVAGETGLSGDRAEALAKKDIFNDFLNLTTNDFRGANMDRTKTPRRRGDARGKDVDRTIMSMRLDHMAELMDNDSAPKVPIDYGKAIKNFMPAEETASEPAQEERRQTPFDGITATYTTENRPIGVQYANPSGAELTANLIASGTSLESFGKETLSQLAKFYGMNLPETAKRGEIIDALNERPAQSPLESQPQETKFVFTTSTKRDEAIKNLIETGNDQGIRDLNKSTILHVLSDMKHIPVTIEDTKGVYQGEKEVSSIIRVTTDNQQDLNKVRSRIADAAKMFQQMEFLEEKMGAGNRNLFGEIDEDGFKHIGSSTLFVEGVTEDQIEAARKQVGLDGLTLADGRIEMYDRSDDPEFFNRVTAFDTAIRQAGGVVASSEAGVASVKSYSEDPQQYAGTIGYDDQSLHLYSKAGEQERLKTPLIQNLMGLMGRPMEAPQGGRKSYFDARDVTPEQVGKQNGIARRFKDLPRNDLESPLVTKAYQHLNTEIAKQYDYLTKGKDGTKFTSQPWSEGGEPYENSSEAINDIRTKNSLKFLKTDPSSFGPKGEDFSYHPLLQDSGRKDANGVSLVYNDLFRAVHDAIAHGLFGAEFGPVGEESAWQTHMRTLDDPWARWALTTETRGQNSFVNYRDEMLGADGMPLKKGDEGYIPLKERGFAEQKAALLPLEDSLTGDKKVDEVTRKLMEELGEKQSQGSAGGISFMPAAGESKPVPTQEKLDEMKARLPKYKSEIEEYEDGRFMVIVRDEDGKFVGQAEATIDGGNKQTDIHESFVDDQYRSQGYGEALYREIAKYSQEKGSESLYGEPISIDALRVRQKLFDTQVEPNPFIEDEAGVRSKVPSDIAFMPADKMDEEYAKSIRFDADPKEARKIVDQAAEKAGYDSSRYWYHGTAGDSFNVPKGRRGVAAHVSLNKEEAWNFAESAPSASSRGGAKPNVREWYLKKGELFDPTNEDHLKKVSDSIEPVREGIRNQPLGGQWALKDDTYNPKTWKDKVWDFFEDSEIQNFIKDAGFIGYMDRESTRTPWENTENAAIFDPNSLKEASLITLDDNKNIIPLSQRFDTSKQDIRFMPESRGEDELVGQDTRRYTGKAPEHDWRKADLQMNVPWSEEVVAEFLGVTEDQNIYKGMIDLSDLNPSVVEFETAKEIRSGEQEVEQMYLDQAEEMLDRYTSEENVNDRFFTKSRGEFEEWQDHLPWDHTSGYDESDVEDLAREMQARDQGGYDEEEYATPRSSGYPPIVVTRKADGSLQIEDGNHRVDTWQKAGYDVAPAWINDEMLRSKEQGGVQFMPYSPELPKTEDGKVDWAGFKAKTLEIAKPLADLRPLGGVSFMPADRPIRKDEPLPEFNSTIIKDVASIEDFKWDRPANVEFDLEDGRKMSFSYDPKYLQVPKFKDLLEELTGEPVILLEADRQRATGGDMGGPLHPFLLSNQVTITGPDGKEYKAVWANMTSTFVSGTKNRMAAHGAKYALVHLMDSMAHKSNKRTARTLDKLMRESNLDQFQKEIVSLAMQGGIIAGKKAALSAGITALGRVLKDSKLSKEDVAKINKLIKEKAAQRDALTPIGMDAEIFKKITAIKTAQSNLNTGRWKQSSLDNAIENLKEFTKTKEYKALLKKNKSLYISDNIGNTFNDRGSAIGSILSLKFGKFEPSKIMRESSDFREGENLDIVTAVELSQNPEMFALYFGKDAKEEAAMSPAERKARDEMRANPNFVEHEAYDWVMLGPKNGNNFLVKNPVKPEQLFKNYRKAHPKKSVKEGSDESVAGAMRKYAGIKLLVGKDAVKMPSTTKNKK